MGDLQDSQDWSQSSRFAPGAVKSQLWIWLITLTAVVVVLVKLSLRQQTKWPPGPRAWPIVGALPMLSPHIPMHVTFSKLADKYGSLFFFPMGSIPTIVVCNADMAKVVLKEKDRIFASRPHSTQGKYLGFDFKSVVFSEYGEYHRRLRSFYQSVLFSPKSVARLALIRERELHRTIRSILERHGLCQTVNLSKAIYTLSMNTLLSMTVGEEVGNDKLEELKGIIRRAMALLGTPDLSDLIPALKVFGGTKITRTLKYEMEIQKKFFKTIIQESRLRGNRTPADGESQTLLQALLALEGDEKPTDDDITIWLLDSIIPGTDTTATSEDWTMAELLLNPEITRRAVEELDTVVGKDRIVCHADIPNLPFIRCIVKESLRLHHSTPLGLPRVSLEDCEVAGYEIPANTILMVHYGALGRDPKYWENPMEFNPNRFLDSDIDVKGQHFQVLPFSSGRRGCVGQNMALAMLYLNVAALVHCFDWVAEGKVDMKENGALICYREKDLKCSVTPRLPSRIYETMLDREPLR